MSQQLNCFSSIYQLLRVRKGSFFSLFLSHSLHLSLRLFLTHLCLFIIVNDVELLGRNLKIYQRYKIIQVKGRMRLYVLEKKEKKIYFKGKLSNKFPFRKKKFSGYSRSTAYFFYYGYFFFFFFYDVNRKRIRYEKITLYVCKNHDGCNNVKK